MAVSPTCFFIDRVEPHHQTRWGKEVLGQCWKVLEFVFRPGDLQPASPKQYHPTDRHHPTISPWQRRQYGDNSKISTWAKLDH